MTEKPKKTRAKSTAKPADTVKVEKAVAVVLGHPAGPTGVKATPPALDVIRIPAAGVALLEKAGERMFNFDQEGRFQISDPERVRKALTTLGGPAWAKETYGQMELYVQEVNQYGPEMRVGFVI